MDIMKNKKQPSQLSVKEKSQKDQLERLLRKHGYARDDRPDHREWTKLTSAFYFKIRLDQNNPAGWNGFQASLMTFMRRDVRTKHLDILLKLLKKEFT